MHGRKMAGLSLVAGVAAAGFAVSPAQAQDVPPVNTGAISLEVGADVVTQYIFRGVSEQNEGFIFQPYAELGVDLPDVGGFDPQLYLGTWNSFHDRGDKWYEADFYIGVGAEVYENITADLAFINYRSPANDMTIQSEIALGLGYNDTALMEQWGLPALNPFVTFFFQTQKGAANASRGVFTELGIEPELPLPILQDGDFPVTFSLPVTLGLNLGSYYDGVDPNNEDSTFGFLDIGIRAGMPLNFIPREYGTWAASAGVHGIWSGDSAQNASQALGTGDRDFRLYGTVGISMAY